MAIHGQLHPDRIARISAPFHRERDACRDGCARSPLSLTLRVCTCNQCMQGECSVPNRCFPRLGGGEPAEKRADRDRHAELRHCLLLLLLLCCWFGWWWVACDTAAVQGKTT
jgi:hypothetical protein